MGMGVSCVIVLIDKGIRLKVSSQMSVGMRVQKEIIK
jgi:hypothetical protein